jgi:effector-binding domain-containing protein
MGKMMGPQFEQGLATLKKVVEERKDWPKISEIRLPEQTVLFIRDSAGPATYGQVFAKGYGEIMKFIQVNKLQSTGHPFAIYVKWDSVTMFSVMDMGIAVERAGKGSGRIRVEKLPEQNAVMATYFGPYDKTASAYQALDQYCREGGKETVGGPWEVYVTDPMLETDPMKVETDIVFPVK